PALLPLVGLVERGYLEASPLDYLVVKVRSSWRLRTPEEDEAMRQSTPILALALLLALVLAAPLAAQTQAERPVALDAGPVPQAEQPRNIVPRIADGFGPAGATFGRAAKGAPLALDGILVGAVETSATDGRVTDSAASATAYACGIKT